MKTRQIPKKNYIIVIIIGLITVFLTFYFKSMYELNKQYQEETSRLSSTLTEISYSTIENYLYEHPETIIYLTDTTNNSKSKIEFESDYINKIGGNELENQLVFLDTSKLKQTDKDSFYKKYSSTLITEGEVFDNMPNILSFKDKKIVDTLFHSYSRINSEDITKFLNSIEMGNKND